MLSDPARYGVTPCLRRVQGGTWLPTPGTVVAFSPVYETQTAIGSSGPDSILCARASSLKANPLLGVCCGVAVAWLRYIKALMPDGSDIFLHASSAVQRRTHRHAAAAPPPHRHTAGGADGGAALAPLCGTRKVLKEEVFAIELVSAQVGAMGAAARPCSKACLVRVRIMRIRVLIVRI